MGIALELRHWNGTSWSTVATTETGAQGDYRFTNIPSLGTGEVYYVRYGFNTTDDRYLNAWFGPQIATYAAGQDVDGGSFDIANVEMLSPNHGSTVTLPATFTWQRRDIGGDTYGWGLFDLSSDAAWWTNDLGNVDSYQLRSLPEGASYWHDYGWYVYVFSGPDGYGRSYYYRRVTFKP